MPREQINPVALGNADDGDMLSGMGAVHVSWLNDDTLSGVDGYVQIGLEVPVDYARFAADNANGTTDRHTFMWTDVLSRKELNHMIRTLKRARDKAYGVDE